MDGYNQETIISEWKFTEFAPTLSAKSLSLLLTQGYQTRDQDGNWATQSEMSDTRKKKAKRRWRIKPIRSNCSRKRTKASKEKGDEENKSQTKTETAKTGVHSDLILHMCFAIWKSEFWIWMILVNIIWKVYNSKYCVIGIGKNVICILKWEKIPDKFSKSEKFKKL